MIWGGGGVGSNVTVARVCQKRIYSRVKLIFISFGKGVKVKRH